jgi:hypothetical protein
MGQRAIPKKCRAIISGQIATIYKGQRIVQYYESGEPLKGKPLQHDGPPYTGYIRGWQYEEVRNG